MKLTLEPSTGTAILVWREDATYCARRAGEVAKPEVCLAVDLFEVIAELSGLDLEDERGAAEAVTLSEEAQRLLQCEHDDDCAAEPCRRLS